MKEKEPRKQFRAKGEKQADSLRGKGSVVHSNES